MAYSRLLVFDEMSLVSHLNAMGQSSCRTGASQERVLWTGNGANRRQSDRDAAPRWF